MFYIKYKLSDKHTAQHSEWPKSLLFKHQETGWSWLLTQASVPSQVIAGWPAA